MTDTLDCRHIRVTGVVQGVGFRPFVWHLARRLGLQGWVRNDALGVEIEIRGPLEQVNRFIDLLREEAPPLARIDGVIAHGAKSEPEGLAGDFTIVDSRGGRAGTMIGHDTAVCPGCLREMFDPHNRRWRYAFSTCTHCGPRYTITRELPYDRVTTSLKPFPLCEECREEYENPVDRRFHAEATCCPYCGPRLTLIGNHGGVVSGDPVNVALTLLREGKILAMKGLGGFHLVCDARNAAAVAALRERKGREEKPFAIMPANAVSAGAFAEGFAGAFTGALTGAFTGVSDGVNDGGAHGTASGVGGGEVDPLTLPERPVILLPKLDTCDAALPGVAPGLAWIGVMLPYTPLQYLLFHEAAGRPTGCGWLETAQNLVLVMTSANPGGEPLVVGNEEAFQRLAGIADAFLVHDREIVTRCDDSVVRPSPGGLQFIRRARGYTPRAIRLPSSGPSILAVGGWYKNTVCITRGNEAFVSQHIGDLDNAAACRFFEETVEQLLGLLQVKPVLIAHDLHPDFHSTRFAADFARERGLPALGVQHHQAHAAAVLAEHGLPGPMHALTLDGVGLGTDGMAWGGELLRLDGRTFERLGHLIPLELPGGDRAAREPWRMAATVLHRLGRGREIPGRFPERQAAPAVAQMLERGVHCPLTSSLGRVFDAAAGLLGVKPVMAFEGQAAMLLEGLAARYGDHPPLERGWRIEGGCLDLMPLLAELVDEPNPGRGAAVFHATLVAALSDWVHSIARTDSMVVGSGGCFLNQILSRGLRSRFQASGLRLIEARHLPPSDGGLALGQAWIAMQHLVEP